MPSNARSARQRVELVKTDGLIGDLAVGERREFLFAPDLPQVDAECRARRMLVRDLPRENAMCWTVAGG